MDWLNSPAGASWVGSLLMVAITSAVFRATNESAKAAWRQVEIARHAADEQRRHMLDMTKPVLDVRCGKYYSDLPLEALGTSSLRFHAWEVALNNRGFGPAIIDDVVFSVGDEDVSLAASSEPGGERVDEILGLLGMVSLAGRPKFRPRTTIGAGESLQLLLVRVTNEKAVHMDRRAVGGLRGHVKYCSIKERDQVHEFPALYF